MSVEVFPEHENVEVFVQECMEDDRNSFTTADLRAINAMTRTRLSDVRKELEGYGLLFVPRMPRKRTRGFQTGSNDRFYGPGSEKMYGGSGHEQINGFAGDKNSY